MLYTAEVESRTQKNPRPWIVLPRTDPLEAKDTGTSVLKKKGLQNFFQAICKRGKQKRSSQNLARFPAFSNIISKINKSSAHHTIWVSSNINPRGKDLLAYCVSAELNFCNVGIKPTFRTKTREEVLELT